MNGKWISTSDITTKMNKRQRNLGRTTGASDLEVSRYLIEGKRLGVLEHRKVTIKRMEISQWRKVDGRNMPNT